jgi:hypothetical protein
MKGVGLQVPRPNVEPTATGWRLREPRCGDGGFAALICDPCPAGWQMPAHGQYDLCCQQNEAGVTDCFSQAHVIEENPGSLRCTGDSRSCKCDQITTFAHDYAAQCEAGATPACVCSVDGMTTGTLTTFAGCPTFSPGVAGPAGVITQTVATNALLARCGAPAE